MGNLFYRSLPPGSPFDPVLDGMRGSGDPAYSAIATNFRCDHRVSKDRQGEFDTPPLWAGADMSAFERMVRQYYEAHVQKPEGPGTAFLRDSNRGNWVYGSAAPPPPFPGHKKLVSCLDLTGLHRVCLAARDTYALPYFCDPDPYPTLSIETSDDVYEWHGRRLSLIGDPENVREHIRQLLSALDRHIEQRNYHHPVWATFWDDYRPLASSRASTWLALVGVAKCFWPRRWLALLCYRVDEVGTLVRPTVLDAGWYAIHFPSPPQAPPTTGGHPVNLDPSPGSPLLREFIHAQTGFKIGHWDATKTAEREVTGGMVAATEYLEEPADMVRGARKAHHSSLAGEYGSEIRIWMPDPY